MLPSLWILVAVTILTRGWFVRRSLTTRLVHLDFGLCSWADRASTADSGWIALIFLFGVSDMQHFRSSKTWFTLWSLVIEGLTLSELAELASHVGGAVFFDLGSFGLSWLFTRLQVFRLFGVPLLVGGLIRRLSVRQLERLIDEVVLNGD